MKKQLTFALLSAALLTTSFAQASTGFSRSSKSSSSSATSSPRASAAPKRDYSSYSSYSTKKTESSKPTYGYSGYNSTPKPSAPPYASPHTQLVMPAAPKPKAVESPRYGQQPAPALTPASAATAKSGFSAESKSSTGKKVAAVAGATALGGALYAATANQDAVAAYESAQKEAAAANARTATKLDTGPVMAQATAAAPAKSTHPSGAAHQSKAQPQVVVVQEAPQYRRDTADEAYWYQRGRDSAQREPAPSTWTTPRAPMPGTAHATAAASPAMPAVVHNSMKKDSNGSGGALFVGLLLVLVLGVGLYFLWTANTRNRPPKSGQPAARKSNYTL